jgi:hypothetical protein
MSNEVLFSCGFRACAWNDKRDADRYSANILNGAKLMSNE